MITLRDYQLRCVKETSAHYKSGVKSVLMQKPTGSGKTRTASYIVGVYAKTGRQVLWLVHREELLTQAAMTFAEYGIQHRMICSASSERAIKIAQFREFGKSFINPSACVVIASIQTVVRRLDKLDWLSPAQIVADECHLSLARTWRQVLAKWPDARLLGLTATPCRLDGQHFCREKGGIYDEIVIGPAPAELIAGGFLADYKIFAPTVHLQAIEKIHIKGGDYDAKDLEEELSSPVVYGDVVSHYRKYSDGKPAIAFCPTVASAERFAAAFRDAGYRAISLDGTTDDIIRRESLKQLGRGELDVVTSVSILVEGTDVPYATTAIMLRRTKSLSLYLQAVGRVMRPHPDKPHAIILDCVGVSAIHGFPDDEREWSLEGETKRKGSGSDSEADIKIMTCPKCFAVYRPARECPVCGNVVEIKQRQEMEQVDGELGEVDRELARLAREKRMQQGRAGSIAELVALGKHPKQAEKIIEAREEKQRLINAVIDAGADAPVYEIRKMKPKELKSWLAELVEKQAVLSI